MDEEDLLEEVFRLRHEEREAEAQAILEKLRDAGTEMAVVYSLLGNMYHIQGMHSQAIDTTRKGTLLAPSSELASLALFHSLWDAGLRDDAFEEMKRFMGQHNEKANRYRELLADMKEELGS
jgi:predicted Zn-dependent protease